MKHLLLFAFACLTMAACAPRTGQVPHASVAPVGVQLDALEGSIGEARASTSKTIETLTEADAKAVRIQEAIRNWR